MKTAMQQLIDFLEPGLKMHDFSQLPAYEKAKELLETEKQVIIEAVIETTQSCWISNAEYLGLKLKFTEEDLENQKQEAEQYYQKTFGK